MTLKQAAEIEGFKNLARKCIEERYTLEWLLAEARWWAGHYRDYDRANVRDNFAWKQSQIDDHEQKTVLPWEPRKVADANPD